MTTTILSLDDLDRLQGLVVELRRAGRIEEAEAVARAHAVVQEMIYFELFPITDDESDPEFACMMEEAEQAIEQGRLIPHEEVLRRLQASDQA